MKIDAEFIRAVAKHPVFYIMIVLVFGIGVVFDKLIEKSDSNDENCEKREIRYTERIASLEKTLDRYTNTILLQKGEIMNRNIAIDSLKNKRNVHE